LFQLFSRASNKGAGNTSPVGQFVAVIAVRFMLVFTARFPEMAVSGHARVAVMAMAGIRKHKRYGEQNHSEKAQKTHQRNSPAENPPALRISAKSRPVTDRPVLLDKYMLY